MENSTMHLLLRLYKNITEGSVLRQYAVFFVSIPPQSAYNPNFSTRTTFVALIILPYQLLCLHLQWQKKLAHQ